MTTVRGRGKEPVGIAVLGTGGIVRRSFVPAVRNTADAKLVAVLSRDKQRARAFADEFGIPGAYDDLGALLADPGVHAVVIATPDAQHEAQAIAAAGAGVHVLCEKPMTTTPAGCERMAEAVRRAGVTFAMGYSLRFLKQIRAIRELVHGGRLGRVRYARAQWSSKTAASQETWRTDPAQTRYWALGRVGTHLVDFYRWCFGEPSGVSGTLLRPRDGGPNDELATVVLTFPQGLIAELTVSVLFPSNSLEIHGEDGALLGRTVFGYALESAPITVNGEPLVYAPNDPFTEEIGDFVRAIRTGEPPLAGLADGLLNVRILDRALTT